MLVKLFWMFKYNSTIVTYLVYFDFYKNKEYHASLSSGIFFFFFSLLDVIKVLVLNEEETVSCGLVM